MSPPAAPVRSKGPKKPTHKPTLPAHLVPGNPGNSGGKKGVSGRKPDEFKALCAQIVSSTETLGEARGILADRTHPAWPPVFKALAAYAYGAPMQAVEVSGRTDNTLTIRVQHVGAAIAPPSQDIGSAPWQLVK